MCVWRATHRYKSRRRDCGTLRQRLRKLAAEYPRYGCWRLCRKLRREGEVVNHKTRLPAVQGEGLSVRKRPRKRLARARVPASVPIAPNVRSMDFVSDSLAYGRKLRVFNVVDDYSREALIMEVDTSIGSQRVARLLDEQATIRGAYPQSVVCDNGPEFIQPRSRSVGRGARSETRVHPTGQAGSELLYRKLQWSLPRRMPQRELVRQPLGCTQDHRQLETRIQRSAGARFPWFLIPGEFARQWSLRAATPSSILPLKGRKQEP